MKLYKYMNLLDKNTDKGAVASRNSNKIRV